MRPGHFLAQLDLCFILCYIGQSIQLLFIFPPTASCLLTDYAFCRSPLLALTMTGQHESPALKRPRGSGFWLDATEKSTSLATGKSDHIADAALFLGCSFRVGWGPNGILIHSASGLRKEETRSVLSSCITFERVALDRTVRDDEGTVRDELVDLQFVSPLLLHMSMSQVCSSFFLAIVNIPESIRSCLSYLTRCELNRFGLTC